MFRDIVDQIFLKIDVDNTEDVELNEFVSFYHNEIVEKQAEQAELKQSIEEAKLRIEQIEDKLTEIKEKERNQQRIAEHPFKRDAYGQPRPIMNGSSL